MEGQTLLRTYDEAIDWIHSRLRLGVKPGLKRMEWLLSKLDNPERRLKSIHVGGTNGKGSTVTYLRSVLNAAGYQVGTFTSPYIEEFNERISINGKPIDNEEILSLVNVIKPLSDELEGTELGAPTEFEVITAMAFYYFGAVRHVDFTIFEVGLGGRFDSTNCITPLASIITNVGMDHVQILGSTIKEIAYQKAGIIKKEIPIFTTSQNDDALTVLHAEANLQNAPLYRLGKDFFISDYQPLTAGEQFTFRFDARFLKNLQISLLGKHQTENAAGALAVLLYLQEKGLIQLEEDQIYSGLKAAYWPGRFECLNKNPFIFIDGAHNVEGMQAFKTAMQTHFPNMKITIVFAALKDKDLTEMFTVLNEMNANIYLTEFDFPRAATATELKEKSGNKTVVAESNWKKLMEHLIVSQLKEEILAVTGSLYFISEVKPYLIKLIDEQQENSTNGSD